MLLVAVQGPGISTAVHNIPTEQLIELIESSSSQRPLTLWFVDTHAVAACTLSGLSSASSFDQSLQSDFAVSTSTSASGGQNFLRSSSLSPHVVARTASGVSESSNSSSSSPLSSPVGHFSQQSHTNGERGSPTQCNEYGAADTATRIADPNDVGVDVVINVVVRATVSVILFYLLYWAIPLEHQAPLLAVGCFTYFVWTKTSLDRVWAKQLL